MLEKYLNRLGTKSLLIVIILLVAIGVYSNAIFNDFVYDDTPQVLENIWIRDFTYLPDIFTNSVWSFQDKNIISNYYRPLMHTIYLINYQIFGLSPWGFHLVNVLFHAGVCVLVFLISSQLLGKSGFTETSANILPSFIASILFAVHPIHTEAVTWVAGLPELTFTLFILLSFYYYIRSSDYSKADHLLSMTFFFLATLCKETALTLPIILICYDYAFAKPNSSFSSRIKNYVPYFLISAVYFLLRVQALGGIAPIKRHAELSVYQYAINVFPLFCEYLEKLVLPIKLNVFHVFHPIESIYETKGVVSLFITTLFILVTFIALKKDKTAFFSFTLIVVPLLPVLYIPGVGENTFAERYLYLPSVGLVILVALAVGYLRREHILRKTVTTSLLAVTLSSFFFVVTISRNSVWKNEYSLFTDTVKKSPDGALPNGYLGKALLDRGKIDEAIEQLQIAIKLDSGFIDAYVWLGNAYNIKKMFDEAATCYQAVLQMQPDNALAYYNLGIVYTGKGWIDKAIEYYLIALKLKPDYAEAHHNLGTAYKVKGWIDKAIEHYQSALRLRPDYAEVYNNIGNTYQSKGWIDKAIEHYNSALRLKSNYAEAHNNLGNAYQIKGEFDKAIEHYNEASRLKPDFAQAHFNLGCIYLKKGLFDMARNEFVITLKITPNDNETQQLLRSIQTRK